MNNIVRFVASVCAVWVLTGCSDVSSSPRDGASSGASGGTTGGAQECPAEPPVAGSSCMVAAEDQPCSYLVTQCCLQEFFCVDGAWAAPAECGQPACPEAPPELGRACDCNLSLCTYDECASGGDLLTYECAFQPGCLGDSGSCWLGVTPSACEALCGDVSCSADEVCVRTVETSGESFACVANPCVDEPISVACASMLCPADYLCIPVGHEIECRCPGCP